MKKLLTILLALLLAASALGALAEAVEIAAEEAEIEIVEAAEGLLAGEDAPLAEEDAVEPAAEVAVANASDVAITDQNFPDDFFREYVQMSFDTDGDGALSKAECSAVKRIEGLPYGAKDLTGIEFFAKLTYLRADGTVEKLDVSKNVALKTLDCANSQIAKLDVSNLKALTELNCDGCALLKKLEVSPCPKLQVLICDGCSKLAKLDVSQCPKLQKLNLSGCALKELDVSKCSSLRELQCGDTQLKKLDVSQCLKLQSLYCNGSKIKTLKLPTKGKLTSLGCGGNPLTKLDVSAIKTLRTLECGDCKKLTNASLKLPSGLTMLECRGCKLTKLDVSGMKNLAYLECSGTPLTSLKLGKKAKLSELYITDCKLSSVDIGGCPLIKAVINSHYLEEGDDTYLAWRLGGGIQTDAKTTLTDGKTILYKKSAIKKVEPVSKSITLKVGQTSPLKIKVTPSYAADVFTVTAQKAGIVEIDGDTHSVDWFFIRGQKKGTTNVTVKSTNGQKAVFKVTVK